MTSTESRASLKKLRALRAAFVDRQRDPQRVAVAA
jgi:hypothetical protein